MEPFMSTVDYNFRQQYIDFGVGQHIELGLGQHIDFDFVLLIFHFTIN